MSSLKKHSKLALIYFLFIAILGVFLRSFHVLNISVDYKYIVHTHSHIALLGWLYTAVTTLIYKFYLKNAQIDKKYKILFWGTQATIIGMLITFPFTGYALFSIIFSSLFLIASYIFVWLFFKYTTKSQKQTYAYKCIRIALIYMALSSIGPWALGYIMNTAGSASSLYRNAIYFYLHFQYNGWFIMATFGLFFFLLENLHITIPKTIFKTFFWLINIGVICTFALSLLWMKLHPAINSISIIGALCQIVAFIILVTKTLHYKTKLLKGVSKLFVLLLKIISYLFIVKLVLQMLGSTPYFSTVISSNMDFVIGYMHWTFLGVLTLAFLGFLYHYKLIKLSKKAVLMYLIGFALTEGLIFYKGAVIWLRLPLIDNYFIYLVVASCILCFAIGYVFILQFFPQNSKS